MAIVRTLGEMTLEELEAGLPAERRQAIERDYHRAAQDQQDRLAVHQVLDLFNSDLSLSIPDRGDFERKITRSIRALRRSLETLAGQVDLVVHLPGIDSIRIDHRPTAESKLSSSEA